MTEFSASDYGFDGCHWVPFSFEVFTVLVGIIGGDRSVGIEEVFDKAETAAIRKPESGIKADGGYGFNELILEFRFGCYLGTCCRFVVRSRTGSVTLVDRWSCKDGCNWLLWAREV